MKSRWSYSLILVSALSISFFVGCNKSSNNGGVSCPDGQMPDASGSSCVGITYVPQGIPGNVKIGFFAQSSNMNGQFNSNGSTFTQGPGFINLLRDAMGVCDRQSQVGGLNYGLSSCTTWMQGFHDIVIQMDGSTANQVKMIVRSSPSVNPYAWYSASIPSFTQAIGCILGYCYGNNSGVFDPLVMDMTVWNINNSQGFELRSQTNGGPTNSYAWWRKLQFQVLNGKIEDQQFNFVLYIDGGNQQMLPAISGTMVRCNTPNCGIQGL